MGIQNPASSLDQSMSVGPALLQPTLSLGTFLALQLLRGLEAAAAFGV